MNTLVETGRSQIEFIKLGRGNLLYNKSRAINQMDKEDIVKKLFSVLIISVLFLTACGQAAVQPTFTSVLSPTLVPVAAFTATPIPTQAPPPNQEDLKKEWEPAFFGGLISYVVCDQMVNTATEQKIEIKTQALVSSIFINPINDLFEEWEPNEMVAPYAENLEADLGILMEIISRWYNDGDVDLDDDKDTLIRTCDSLFSTFEAMKASAVAEGMTEETLGGIITEIQNYGQEVADSAQSKSPTSSKEDGFYTVGDGIAAGKWESTGLGDGCYWARYDDKQEILGNHYGLAGSTMTIHPDDFEVEIKGCGTWEYVEGKQREPMDSVVAPKENGFYTVGVEIAAGKWKSTGSGDSCYWARLDGNQDILDNHFGLAGGTVTIRSGDYEVEFKDCGIWEYIGP